MPKVIINDEEFEASKGEVLLDVARRNGAHVGFICNGNGLCTLCECKVLMGDEVLNPVTEVEKGWLSTSKIKNGSRLGCQATIESGNGTVQIITRVEEMKRQFLGTLNVSDVGNSASSLFGLFKNVSDLTIEHMFLSPRGFVKSINNKQGPKGLKNPLKELDSVIKDSGRVINRQFSATKMPEPPRPKESGKIRAEKVRIDID